MARKPIPTAVQEELYPVPGSREHDAREHGNRSDGREVYARESFDDSRALDLETEQESPFLRAQKRINVRRGSLPKKTASGLKWAGLALAALAVSGTIGAAVYSYGKHSWRFRIDSSDQIEVSNAQHVTRAQIMDVMGGDIGRNIFFVPLAQRQQQLDQIPWVESASVMRLVPNRLRIEIHERNPVAFARIGSHISLIDAGGNLMELTPGPRQKYSFPVITGMNANEPLSTRALRMRSYNELVQQLDSGGAHYSRDISEVDLTDGEDVKVMTGDSAGGVLVHLGNSNYLQRYKVYISHIEAWRQQFEKLESVDLRYDGQIIVNPDLEGLVRQPALTPAAAKAALAAGVKNAAIVNYEKYVNHPAPAAPGNKPTVTRPKTAAKPVAKDGSRMTTKASAHRAAAKVRSRSVAKSTAVARPPAAPAKTTVPAKGPDSIKAKPASKAPSAAGTASSATEKSPAARQPQATASRPATALAGNLKKPSPAIPKEGPQN